MKRFAAGALTWMVLVMFADRGDTQDGVIGEEAPAWRVEHWINSEPIELESLRGQVVLVRWWTGPGCPYCSNSAPALAEFHKAYAERGLRVIGFYHHKSSEPLSTADVRKLADRYEFEFPVAVDPDWQTLRAWWLDTGNRNFTSVSFLIDRKGVIRHIHPGGQYVKGDEAYSQMKSAIERLIQE